MSKHRILSVGILIIGAVLVFGLYLSEKPDSKLASYAFRYGLDLSGGTELVYKADTSAVKGDIASAMATLRDVIERRVNIFGVSEPIIHTEEARLTTGEKEYRLVVELPGVTNVEEAVAMIGKTPALEFMLLNPEAKGLSQEELSAKPMSELFIPTGLSGRYIDRASLEFTQVGAGTLSGQPIVGLTFNDEGRDLFANITKTHKGEVLAIFLDGTIISSPVIQDTITDGKAVISGTFTPEEARELVRSLNYGALPVPVSLVSTETIGPSLGESAKTAGVQAGMISFAFLVVFMLVYYRVPGFVASVSLVLYVILSLVVFKLIPVTLTAAGIAGFILSIGMALDANILIFERTKEEMRKGKSIRDALHEGFARAWLSIRDSNISSIITALILFWIGTSAVKGFAFTLGIGVLISMCTAIMISRTFLFAIAPQKDSKMYRFLFSNGLSK